MSRECMRRECIDRHVHLRELEKQVAQYESDLARSWERNEELEAALAAFRAELKEQTDEG